MHSWVYTDQRCHRGEYKDYRRGWRKSNMVRFRWRRCQKMEFFWLLRCRNFLEAEKNFKFRKIQRNFKNLRIKMADLWFKYPKKHQKHIWKQKHAICNKNWTWHFIKIIIKKWHTLSSSPPTTYLVRMQPIQHEEIPMFPVY